MNCAIEFIQLCKSIILCVEQKYWTLLLHFIVTCNCTTHNSHNSMIIFGFWSVQWHKLVLCYHNTHQVHADTETPVCCRDLDTSHWRYRMALILSRWIDQIFDVMEPLGSGWTVDCQDKLTRSILRDDFAAEKN